MIKIVEKLNARVRNKILNLFCAAYFQPEVQERVERERFFYNSFKALSFNGVTGDYVEFGCHSGGTFSMAYKFSRLHGLDLKLWAFDSFQGLPAQKEGFDAHPEWIHGNMSMGIASFRNICRLNGIPEGHYETVEGFYEQTLPKFSPNQIPNNVALAFIDCDLYTSTCCVLDFLSPRLKHGMIIAFDDYYCWTEKALSGERNSLLKFLSDQKKWTFLPYASFGWHGQSFVVESKNLIGSKDTSEWL